LYGLAYLGMGWWGDYSQQALGAGARVSAEVAAGGGSPNARPNVWRTTWLLILQHPWTGVGFGEFNFAWSLTAFDHRPTAFFDHTHNLALQLMVELGLPLSALVLLLMAAALVQAGLAALRAQGEAATVSRACLLLVLLCGLHSQVEYPLWYAYFLLPTALAWGLALGTPGRPASDAAAPARSSVSLAGMLAGVVMVAGGVLALVDYQRVVEIYAPSDNSGPLAARIAHGQRSPLFAHQADYAAATNEVPPASAALGLMRATHSLLDTRLMIAWARQLALTGQVDAARWLAQRLREFHNPDSDEFFAPCDKPEGAAKFQCQPPKAQHPWREFTTLPLLLPTAAAQPAPASSARQ
ncbi:MAG: polymerase, partial [Burkholderiales bacterium PBB5]